MADGSNPSTTVSDYLCDIQLLHLSNTLLFFNIKVFFGEQLMQFLSMPVNTAI